MEIGWGWALILVILANVLLVGALAVLVLGAECMCRTERWRKYGEAALLIPAAWLMLGLGWYTRMHDSEREAAYENMRAALIRCGEMLKNGERERLKLQLTFFLRSPEAKKGMYSFSVAFLRAVAPEKASAEGTGRGTLVPEARYGAMCLVFLGIWGVMFLCRAKPTIRCGYLFGVCILCFGIWWCAAGEYRGRGEMVRLLGARWDVELLLDEISRPGEIAPELLPQLENPGTDGPPYIRLPLRPKPENEER